jgi:hypothetical protein
MEIIGKKASAGSRSLRRYYFYFCAASLICLIVVTVDTLLSNYAASLRRSVALLETRRGDAVKATASMKLLQKSSSELRAAIPADAFKQTPDRLILVSLDKLKTIAPKGILVVGTVQTKDNETTLPITLKGSLADYPGFLGVIGRLQTMRFPFAVIDEVLLVPPGSGGTTEATYEIRGVLKTPDTTLSETGKGD